MRIKKNQLPLKWRLEKFYSFKNDSLMILNDESMIILNNTSMFYKKNNSMMTETGNNWV